MNRFEQQIARWSDNAAYLVPDTGFFLNHEEKFHEADYRALIDTSRIAAIHVLIPMAVVDELDGSKRAKGEERHRAILTLAILESIMAGNPMGICELRRPDMVPITTEQHTYSGPVTIEILFDPPGHVRAGITDDEIVSRAASIMPLAARRVTILTYDSNMAMRARNAGLDVQKLRRAEEESEAEIFERPRGWGSDRGDADVNPSWEERPAEVKRLSDDWAASE